MLRDVLKSKANVDVVKLQKSGGVVSRNAKVRQKARGSRIRVCSFLLHFELLDYLDFALPHCFFLCSSILRCLFVSSRLQEYFYGPANDLSPHSNIASFSDLLIYRIGGGPQAPRSALPVGAEPVSDRLRVAPVIVNQDLHHLVLAVSFAKEPDEIISRCRN